MPADSKRRGDRLGNFLAGGTSAGLATAALWAWSTFAKEPDLQRLRDQIADQAKTVATKAEVEALRERVHVLDNTLEVMRAELGRKYE